MTPWPALAWNKALAEQCRADISVGRSIKPEIVKIAPKGFIAALREQRKVAGVRVGFVGKLSASQIRAEFKARGIKGKALTARVDAVLTGNANMIWAEYEGPPKDGKVQEKSRKLSLSAEARQLRREQIADELGIKPTDAMFWKVAGSYESSKR